MKINEILSKCDHALLSRTATLDDILRAVDDGKKYKVASVCIPPCFVKEAKIRAGNLPICTVIGFPNGYSSTQTKLFEADEALQNGADEIDFVINTGFVKAGDYGYVLREIETLKKACGQKILKVIVETCLLDNAEKLMLCKLVYDGGADYIKTSTGFASGGATAEDIKLFKSNIDPSVKIKAAGGIRTLRQAEEFILLGADRIGTGGIINEVKKSREKM